jgi:microcystin-dependent protein
MTSSGRVGVWLGCSLMISGAWVAAAQSPTLAVTATAQMPIGTVIAYAGPVDAASRAVLAAAGWQVCDGAALGRVKYANLYKVIGDIHGRGDAVSTFNLPDYRGRFLRGVSDGSGRDPEVDRRDPAAPGGLSGDNVGSVQGDQFAMHTHGTVQMIADNSIDGVDSVTIHSGEHHNEPRETGGAGGLETRPKNAYVHWLILAGT